MKSGRFPLPENAAAVDESDVYKAVYDFVSEYGLPEMDSDESAGRIFRGYTNRMSLPKDNEYAVITVIGHYRRGTTVEDFDASEAEEDEDGVLTLSEYIECDVQIDFYSETRSGADNARRRAQAVETVARSSVGPQFFAEYGLACEYAENARDLSFVSTNKQYVSRWSVTLRLGYTTAVAVDIPWFDSVNLNRFENVDVDHPSTD